MPKMMPGTNITVFLIFFGISVIDAATSHNWLRTGLWLVFGSFFLGADLVKRAK